jgi:hypothetical protein
MSSELLGAAQNVLKGNLGGAWDINKGYADAYTDLGIARRFGGAAAAYSLRDIGAMNGRVVRVRRDSDDAEEDFSANQVASGALEDFVGSGNDGFVAKWYDQSRNGNDVVQGTNGSQPKIVESGSILKEGDNPTIKFDGSDDFLQIESQVLSNSSSGAVGLYSVVNSTASQAGYVAGSASDDSGGKRGMSIYAGTTKFILTNGNSASTTSQDTIPITNGSSVLISACYNNNATNTLQKNSSTTSYSDGSSAYNFLASSSFTIGHRERSAGTNAATNLQGTISEVLAFNTDTTSDRSEIQSEIQKHYNL